MITEVLNSFLNVRNKVKKVNGEWEDKTVRTERIGMREAFDIGIPSSNGVVNIYTNWGKKIIIDEFTYNITTRPNNNSFYPRLNSLPNYPTSNWVGQLFHVVKFGDSGGGNREYARVTEIERNHSEYLEVVAKNDDYQSDAEDPRVLRIV